MMRAFREWALSLAPVAALATALMFALPLWLKLPGVDPTLQRLGVAMAGVVHRGAWLLLGLVRAGWLLTFVGIFHERQRRRQAWPADGHWLVSLLNRFTGTPTAPPVASLWSRAPWWRASVLGTLALTALFITFGPLYRPQAVMNLPPMAEVVTYTPPGGSTAAPGNMAIFTTAEPPVVAMPSTRPFTNSFAMDGFELPLPPGQWLTLAGGDAREGNAVGKHYLLGQIEHGRLMAAVQVTSLRNRTQLLSFHGKGCDALHGPSVYSQELEPASSADHQSCWRLSHVFTPPLQHWHDAAVPMSMLMRTGAATLAASHVGYAQDYVQVEFIRAEPWGLLEASYWFNPEREGIASDPAELPGNSNWRAGNVSRYPEKLAFIDGLKQWGGIFRERFDRAFDAGK